MGSRLCMAGGVQAIYIKTVQGVLIKVEPHTHIPKTLGPFCAMMSQLLQKLSIKARGKGEKLLRLVENPVTKYLPLNSHIIGLSFSSKKAVRIRDYIGNISNDQSLVFVVGAMAHGKIDCDYINDFVSETEASLEQTGNLGFFPWPSLFEDLCLAEHSRLVCTQRLDEERALSSGQRNIYCLVFL
ncbi:hypothetical protein C3L33_15334, partial [Rhododendron williamsianum]